MNVKRESIKNWLKKRSVSDYLFGVFLVLMLIPATRKPIQVQLIRLLSFAPGDPALEDSKEKLLGKDLSWQMIDENGKLISFQELANRKVFINHWATWCPPCVAEMPSIEELFHEMRSDMTFVVMSTEPIDKLKQFKISRGYTFPVYQIAGPLPDWMQKSNSIPATFILDGEQNLRLEHFGARKWNKPKFVKALKQLP